MTIERAPQKLEILTDDQLIEQMDELAKLDEAELEQLLTESVVSLDPANAVVALHSFITAVPAPTPPAAPAHLSLEDLLAESMEAAHERTAMKDLRKNLAEGGVEFEERRKSESLLRSWEAKREWTRTHDNITFNRCRCKGCGNFSTQFMGYFETQVHRSNPGIKRWIAVQRPVGDLPKEARYLDHNVPTCENCAEFAGYPVEESDDLSDYQDLLSDSQAA